MFVQFSSLLSAALSKISIIPPQTDAIIRSDPDRDSHQKSISHILKRPALTNCADLCKLTLSGCGFALSARGSTEVLFMLHTRLCQSVVRHLGRSCCCLVAKTAYCIGFYELQINLKKKQKTLENSGRRAPPVSRILLRR